MSPFSKVSMGNAEYQKKAYNAAKKKGLCGHCRKRKAVNAGRCVPCRTYLYEWRLKNRFGLTGRDYEEMLKQQNGTCAICHHPPKKKRLDVDHNHQTGEIRGLLCFSCNYGLGFFERRQVRFRDILAYVEKAGMKLSLEASIRGRSL